VDQPEPPPEPPELAASHRPARAFRQADRPGAEIHSWTRNGLLVLARDRSERVMADSKERLLALLCDDDVR